MRPLSHVVPAALAYLLRGAPLSDGKVTFAWRAAVGPALERATSVRLENGVLMVDTVSAEWSHEITRSRGVILARLKALLGDDAVTSIQIRS